MILDVEADQRVGRRTSRVARETGAVHIVERLAPGGIETLVLDLVRESAGRNAIFSLSGEREELIHAWPALQTCNAHIEAFGRPPRIDPFLVFRIARRLAILKPNVVLVHHIGPLLYGGMAATLARVPRLVHVEHDCWHYDQPRHRSLVALSSRLFRPRHIAVSHQIARELRKIAPPSSSITVIPPGVDLAKYRPGEKTRARDRIGLPRDALVIGTVARLVPEKGLACLIQALAHLPDARLVIAGDGPQRSQLEQLAAGLNVTPRLHILGLRDDVAQLYPAFDVFCLPSLSEGFPRTILEAQACNVPVVATRVGAVADALCPRTGVLVEPSNAVPLANALKYVLERQAPAASPRDHISEGLSWAMTQARFRAAIAGA